VTAAEECTRTAPPPANGIFYMLKGKEYEWVVDVYDEQNHKLTHDVCAERRNAGRGLASYSPIWSTARGKMWATLSGTLNINY
jgi:hypothetical protein